MIYLKIQAKLEAANASLKEAQRLHENDLASAESEKLSLLQKHEVL